MVNTSEDWKEKDLRCRSHKIYLWKKVLSGWFFQLERLNGAHNFSLKMFQLNYRLILCSVDMLCTFTIKTTGVMCTVMLMLTVCRIVSKMSIYESLFTINFFARTQDYSQISGNQFPKQGFDPWGWDSRQIDSQKSLLLL